MTEQSTEAGKAKERWLKSGSHEQWAEAMLACQHAGAFCGADGYCHLGGDCFKRERKPTVADLAKQLERIELELAEIKKALKR